jgi:hypothetical protein
MPVSIPASTPPAPAGPITDSKAPPAPTPPDATGLVDLSFSQTRTLTRQQQDAAQNCVAGSKHSRITLLPNHSLTTEGELEGFSFQCSVEDSAAMLPISKSTFGMTAIYECLMSPQQAAGQVPTPYLQLVSDMQQSTAKLQEVVSDLENSPLEPLKLDCMPDWENLHQSMHNIRDQREWVENMPGKIGLYHCFMRTNAQNRREHKVFIVISGHCAHASEELYNLWLDARESISAREFMQCAEISWLRQSTMRHHNRLAARVAHKFNLTVRFMTDASAVGPPTDMLLPTTCTVYRDLSMHQNVVQVSNDAAIMSLNKSGVIFDCWGSEGFWVFMGPRDMSSYKIFGTDFRTSKALAFPCKTVRYHMQYQPRDRNSLVITPSVSTVSSASTAECKDLVSKLAAHDPTQTCLHQSACRKFSGFMFPHTAFVQELEKLGFNQNDGITNLMPIVAYCTDE